MFTSLSPPTSLDPLILDFLEWIAREPRSHADVMDAWRTSCPRLTVWEDAMDRGYVARKYASGQPVEIALTSEGRAFLATRASAAPLLAAE